jgi:2,3-bisphosphoglycerate-independent phosphoglycerate mutase
MQEGDVAMRCNIVTLSEEEGVDFSERTILDHSSGEISTEDAAVLVDALRPILDDETFHIYVGTSYRHCLIEKNGSIRELSQPHDHLGSKIGEFLPSDERLLEMMKKSYEILKDHPINLERKKRGENPANCVWFWGAGTKPALSPFEEVTGLKGVMISAVDLLKGIAVGAKMGVKIVPGATGGLDTNYEGKANAAVDALLNEGYDFAYIHVEAPDEMGHQGSVPKKIKSIENLDQRVVKVVMERMKEAGEPFRLAILPDHPTPIRIRTHSSDPVPFLIYDSANPVESTLKYNEKDAAKSGVYLPQGPDLIKSLLPLGEGGA